MQHGLLKSITLKLISLGINIPDVYINRISELTFLKKLLDILDINCVIDVGANRGQYAHELRAIGYTGYIISFEPIQQEFSVLSKSFCKDSKWTGYQIALGSENKITNINVSKLTVMSSILDIIRDNRPTTIQRIEVKRLDDLFTEIIKNIACPNIFLKMDTQGYDLEVFKGSKQCLSYIRGIQSEISVQPLYRGMPHYTESLSVYEEAGFELYNLSVVNRILTGGLLELNAFMNRPMESK